MNANEQGNDKEYAYRHYLADMIMGYVTAGGTLPSTDAHRQIMAVTERTLHTVKNWLAYRINLPDVASLARICTHWSIPAEKLLPPNIGQLLTGQATAAPVSFSDNSQQASDTDFFSLYPPVDVSKLNRALEKYSSSPRSMMVVPQNDTEMMDQIRPGELMFVDPSCESIQGNGMYLLRLSDDGRPGKRCVRNVDRLLSESAVRISCGSSQNIKDEIVPLIKGLLPPQITVLGKVLAVIRQT